jgi:hypothetical protein
MKIDKQFLQDRDEHLSSKRLGFLGSLPNWLLMAWVTLITLLFKGKYQLAVDMVWSVGVVTLGFAGFVASEFFRKKDANKNT